MVQFLFLDRADLPEHTLRASNTSQSVTPRGDLITTTTTTYIKAPETQGSVCLSCVGDVSFAFGCKQWAGVCVLQSGVC